MPEILGESGVAEGIGDNGRMFRRKRLHEDFASFISSPCPSGNLGDQLKRFFRCSKIGKMKRRVGIDHTDEKYVREIESLCNHLSP